MVIYSESKCTRWQLSLSCLYVHTIFFFFFFAFITELVSEYNCERTVHECGSEFIDELRLSRVKSITFLV